VLESGEKFTQPETRPLKGGKEASRGTREDADEHSLTPRVAPSLELYCVVAMDDMSDEQREAAGTILSLGVTEDAHVARRAAIASRLPLKLYSRPYND
jgi:hypothetical protein